MRISLNIDYGTTKKKRPGGRWMKQVAGHVGAEIGRQRINVQARCKFHALIGGAGALCGTRVDCAEPL